MMIATCALQAYAHDVAAEGTSTAGVELQSRGMSMAFVSQQVCSSTLRLLHSLDKTCPAFQSFWTLQH